MKITAISNISNQVTFYQKGKFPRAITQLAVVIFLVLAILYPSSVKATNLPVVNKSGTLSSSESWTAGNVYYVSGSVVVPDSITLTIDPDAIVKFGWLGKIQVNSGGTLHAAGTSTDPIIFTSYSDDTYGGDSNNNGSSTGTEGDYSQAIQNSGGELTLQYAEIYYPGNDAVNMSCDTGEISEVEDNYLNGSVNLNGTSGCGTTVIQRNEIHVTKTGMDAMFVYPASLPSVVLSGSNANSFTGTSDRGRSVVTGGYGSLASGKTWTASSDDGAVIVLDNNLSVSGDLTIEPGTIVKNKYYGKISVNSGGTLTADGTSTDPIIFTSYSDDTYGGDSNGNGSSTGTEGDYTQAIQNSGGELTLQYAEIYYPGNDAVNMSCDTGEISEVEDNYLNGSVNLNGTSGCGTTVIQRNEIHVTKTGMDAMFVYPASLPSVVLSGSNANSFTGTSDRGRSVVTGGYGSLASGKTWTASSDDGAVIVLDNNLSVSGDLTIEPGTIVKNKYYGKISVNSGGTLTADGTSTDPIIFTSYSDDTYGGDSNGNGSSTGSVGDYTMAVYAEGDAGIFTSYTVVNFAGTAYYMSNENSILDAVDISYVNYGLVASGEGHTVIRGKLTDIATMGIQSCDWLPKTCTVDATYMEWGSDEGPFLTLSDDLVCGSVNAKPWIYESTPYTNNLIFGSQNCGSTPPPSPDTELIGVMNAYTARVALAQENCDYFIQEECDVRDSIRECILIAYNLAASNAPFSMPNASDFEEAETYSSDAVNLFGIFVGSLTDPDIDLIDADYGLGFAEGLDTIVDVAIAYDECVEAW